MQTLYFILNMLGIPLFFCGAWCLRRQARSDRAVRVLLFILLMWGAAYLAGFLFQLAGRRVVLSPMSLEVLIVGNLYVIISMLYPIEAVRPGWLGIRSLTGLVLPYVGVTVQYFAVLEIRNEPVRRLSSIADMLLNIDEFNVWYRFVFYLTMASYIAYLLLCTSRIELDYRKYRSGDADAAALRAAPRCMHYYGIGMGCITVVFLFVLLYGTPLCVLIHRCIVLPVFAYTVYRTRKDASGAEIAL